MLNTEWTTDAQATGPPDDIQVLAGTIAASSSCNLIGSVLISQGGSSGPQNEVNGNRVGVTDMGLAPLANNGGPTPTIALLPGSPAIDAGSVALAVDPATGLPLATDQRGAGFARIVNGTVDIGAFEAGVGGTTGPPTIIGEQLLTAGGRKKAHLAGFELVFSQPLDASRARNAANYEITQTVRRGRKRVTQRVPIKAEYVAAIDAVRLILAGKPTFSLGGTITVNASAPNGITNVAGIYLDGDNAGVPGDDGVFTILPKARGVMR